MPASSFYAEAEYNEPMYAQSFQAGNPDEEQSVDDLISLEMESPEATSVQRASR